MPQAQAVFCDAEAGVSVWCALQMLMFEHRLHKDVSIFNICSIDAVWLCFSLLLTASQLTGVYDARVHTWCILEHV